MGRGLACLDASYGRGILGFMTKWIMGIAAVAVVAAGLYWYFFTRPAAPATPAVVQQTVPPAPDTTDQGLAQDLANLDAQLVLNADATSTSGLPAQVAQVAHSADMMASLAVKLAMRINALGASSTEATALAAKLSDLNSKVADAHTQATAALGHIANATASDAPLATTNAEYAKTRADMHVAKQDFTAARTDITAIFSGLSITATATATSSASTTTLQ